MRDLSVYLTAGYYAPDAMSLRWQLSCLAQQTVRDFDVVILDPHYAKRRAAVREMSERSGLTVTHLPYTGNWRVSRFSDWTMLNSAFAMIESRRLLRLSCYRAIPRNMVELVLATPAPHNVDFGYCAIPADHAALGADGNVRTELLPTTTDTIHRVQSRYRHGTDELEILGELPAPGETSVTVPVTMQVFGNGAWWRDQRLRVNGICEAFSAGTICEDLEFDVRAATDGQTVTLRVDCPMIRIEHAKGPAAYYGSRVPPDHAGRLPCEECYLQARDRSYLTTRLARGDFEVYGDLHIIVCRDCHLADGDWLTTGEDFYKALAKSGRVRSAILPKYKIGRNLSILAHDMAGKSWSSKLKLLERSWTHPRYYAP